MSETSPNGACQVIPGRLLVCGRCHALRGPVPNRDDGAEQLCWCAPLAMHRAQPQWGDFNKYAEFCYCCGLALLPSGSKWAPFFCKPCLDQVRRFNRAARRCLIPIGRHSIMNGVALSGDFGEAEVTQFISDVETLATSQDALLHFALEVAVTRNLEAIGCPAGEHLPLETYLHRTQEAGLTYEGTFDRLVEWVRSQ